MRAVRFVVTFSGGEWVVRWGVHIETTNILRMIFACYERVTSLASV